MNIILVGMNHKTAPLEIREKLSISCDDDAATFEKIKKISHINEALYLSTCNRVEVLAHVSDAAGAEAYLKDLVFSHGNLSSEEMEKCLYVYRDDNAVRHLFRVASSLDSMVMGEPQILGQVKDAYRRSVEQEATGVMLNKLLHHAFRAAKRVRTETAIANNAVSVSYTAVQLAKKIFGNLRGKNALVIGAGEMAELAARNLTGNGVKKVIFTNRTYERALKMANDLHGDTVSFDLLEEALSDVDIIISSTGAPGYIIHEEMIAAALRRRKNRLLFIIDIAVPRDVDPLVGKTDNVYLYNIDNLQSVVDDNMKNRIEEAEKAEVIVDEEVTEFSRWLDSLQVVPTIVDLRGKVESIIKGEMGKAGSWMKNLDEGERENVEVLVNSIINKILHDPVTGLKEESENGGANPYVAVIKKLFKLE
ncbi:MAG: glutamyl-tRNA reductase [Thermodesulfobacteriota bacterium]|nr:glutamyl-tRNA reductase [Thermodesulfobacteriota bacterium]